MRDELGSRDTGYHDDERLSEATQFLQRRSPQARDDATTEARDLEVGDGEESTEETATTAEHHGGQEHDDVDGDCVPSLQQQNHGDVDRDYVPCMQWQKQQKRTIRTLMS